MAFIHLNHIFCGMSRRFFLILFFCPVSLYAFDFKFHIQGYILIKSVSCCYSTEVISLMLNASCHFLLLLLLLLLLLIFQSPYKSRIFLNKLVFQPLLSSSRLTGVEGGVKMLLVFDTSV